MGLYVCIFMQHRAFMPTAALALRQRETACYARRPTARLNLDIRPIRNVKPSIPGRFGPRHFAVIPEVFSGGVNGSGVRPWFSSSFSAKHRRMRFVPGAARPRLAASPFKINGFQDSFTCLASGWP